MRAFIISLFSTVQLTRLTNAFAGVANLWFVVLWTRSVGEAESTRVSLIEWPLWVVLGITAVLGVSVSMYAGAINDVFDARRDRVFSPGRPIPSGRISIETASLIGFISLLISVLAAISLGNTVLYICLLCTTAILFYNTMARHVPSLGLLTVSVIYGSHMLMPNLGLRFIWPILLVMVHATIVHAVVYKLLQKRPKFSWLTIVGVVLGYSVIILVLVAQTGHRGIFWDNATYPWYGFATPLAAVITFTVSSVNKIRFASSPKYAAEKLERYGSLWMGIYGVCWLLGGGRFIEAMILGLLVLLGIIWMMTVRDLGVWIEQPVGYRW